MTSIDVKDRGHVTLCELYMYCNCINYVKDYA